MRQTAQTISNEWFNTSVESHISESVEIETAMEFQISCAQAAVSEALGAEDAIRGTGSPGNNKIAERRLELPDDHTGNLAVVPTVRRLPTLIPASPPMATFHALQEWEGYVASVEGDTLVARLVDLTAGQTHESEEAIIPLEELSNRDAENLALGDIFRWVIGYEHSPAGERKRVSKIVFRELPRMTESDFREGREWAEKVTAVIDP